MPSVKVTTRDGVERTIQVPLGRSLMQGLRDAGIDEVQAICGGCGACCTCQVFVDDADLPRLPQMSEEEDALLESSDFRRSSSRLACQIPVTDALDGLAVTIAPEF